MTPTEDESLREAREALERRDPPRDEEEAASFKGMGHAVTVIRERRGLTREQVASKAEMTVLDLERIEGGELHERWGDLRRVAKGLGVPFPALMMEAEEFAPGPGGEEWRKWSGEAEGPGARSDAAENRKQQP